VNKVAHEEEQNIGLFGLLLGMLGTLNLKNADYTTYILAFRLRLASLFGYMPDFNSCKKCGSRIDTGGSRGDMMFKISNGGVICDKCNGPGRRAIREREDGFVPLSAGALQISRKLMDLRWGSLGNLKYEKKIGNEIDDIIRLYLRYHFDGLQTIKSIENFQNNE
jgi:DNA repair protein RecO